MRCCSAYRLPPSSSLSSDMPNSMRMCGPFAFSGFAISMDPGWIRHRYSSPELMLHSSSWESLTALGGVSCRFVGGALVADAGGGGASFSSVFSSSSSPRRCCRSRVSSCSRFLLVAVFFSYPPRFHGPPPVLFEFSLVIFVYPQAGCSPAPVLAASVASLLRGPGGFCPVCYFSSLVPAHVVLLSPLVPSVLLLLKALFVQCFLSFSLVFFSYCAIRSCSWSFFLFRVILICIVS